MTGRVCCLLLPACLEYTVQIKLPYTSSLLGYTSSSLIYIRREKRSIGVVKEGRVHRLQYVRIKLQLRAKQKKQE
ncbi:hypothetical protein GGI43DRAFT_396222 [Trichoderma evansii]